MGEVVRNNIHVYFCLLMHVYYHVCHLNVDYFTVVPTLYWQYGLYLFSFHPQDLVIYSLSGSCTVFGQHLVQSDQEKERPAADVKLWAPDIKQQHCSVRHLEVGPASDSEQELKKRAAVTVLKPLHGAAVKRNGVSISEETKLQSGDVIGLGDHYLFMFKDPLADRMKGDTPAVTLPWLADAAPLCKSCVLSMSDGPLHSLPCLRDAGGRRLSLGYDVEHEERLLKEIFTRADSHDGAHKLTPSFLLCLCLQQSATHFHMADLRRLLLQTASEVQMAVWVRPSFETTA